MKVSELGEFGLIDLLAKMIADSEGKKPTPRQPVIGIGDDAAAWHSDASIQLATIDTMIQGVHFSLDTITWKELGWKSLAINLSDIAAMGGVPQYALVALALPEDTEVEDVAGLYEGMIELARQSQVAIIGGNVSRSPVVSVTITVLGNSLNNETMKRSTKEGQLLLKLGITTAIDTSDGLLADLRHICEASEVGARVNIDRLPVHPAVSSNFGERSHELALSGGEDYELLFTGSAEIIDRVRAEMEYPVTAIGEITSDEPGKISIIDADGNPVEITKTGWEHF